MIRSHGNKMMRKKTSPLLNQIKVPKAPFNPRLNIRIPNTFIVPRKLISHKCKIIQSTILHSMTEIINSPLGPNRTCIFMNIQNLIEIITTQLRTISFPC